jgi:nitrilase
VTTNNISAACLQLCSSDNIEENLTNIRGILQKNKQPFDLLLLPENATLLTHDKKIKQAAAKPENIKETFHFFSGLAKQYNCWLIAGSLLIQDKNNPDKYFNHCPVFAPGGAMMASYDKMHLFDVDLGSESWQESSSITAGQSPASVKINTSWKVGLSICYDLRFPELYREYSAQGCNILSVPAAFTVPTGKAHWDILLKARAIENQAYVLAAGQAGQHADGRKTYGHSQIINPWGETLAQLKQGEGLICATLDIQFLDDLKQRMPVLKHRQL